MNNTKLGDCVHTCPCWRPRAYAPVYDFKSSGKLPFKPADTSDVTPRILESGNLHSWILKS
jgi:hypothetical protein